MFGASGASARYLGVAVSATSPAEAAAAGGDSVSASPPHALTVAAPASAGASSADNADAELASTSARRFSDIEAIRPLDIGPSHSCRMTPVPTRTGTACDL